MFCFCWLHSFCSTLPLYFVLMCVLNVLLCVYMNYSCSHLFVCFKGGCVSVCVCVWWLMWGILQPDGAEQGPSISIEKSSGQKAGRAICLGPTPPVDTHMDPGSLTVEPSESTRSRGFGSEHLPACLVAARVNMRFSVLLLEMRMVLKFSRPCVVPTEPSRCNLNSRVVAHSYSWTSWPNCSV